MKRERGSGDGVNWPRIAVVLLFVFLLKKHRWHFRSVDCRCLAEQLRVLCYIFPLGLTPPSLRLPAHHLHSDVQNSWMEWRLRALLRQQPLLSGNLTAAEATGVV